MSDIALNQFPGALPPGAELFEVVRAEVLRVASFVGSTLRHGAEIVYKQGDPPAEPKPEKDERPLGDRVHELNTKCPCGFERGTCPKHP